MALLEVKFGDFLLKLQMYTFIWEWQDYVMVVITDVLAAIVDQL